MIKFYDRANLLQLAAGIGLAATTDQICPVEFSVIRQFPQASNRSPPQITDHAQQSASATIVTRKNSASATVVSFYPRNDFANPVAAGERPFQEPAIGNSGSAFCYLLLSEQVAEPHFHRLFVDTIFARPPACWVHPLGFVVMIWE